MKNNYLALPNCFRRAACSILAISLTMLLTNACNSKSGAKPSDLSASTNDNIITVPQVSKNSIVSTTPVEQPEIKREFHANPYVAPTSDPKLARLEKKWGIQVVGLRLTSAGYMLDFRFKVIAPEKAAPLLSRTVKPYLTDETSGYKFYVPVSGKVGALRQDAMKPTRNRIYYSFFANPGGFLKRGSKVTITIGNFEAKHIVVE